ncbi:outer membrane beta-barrel family protein [Nibrella saemangeumensis]|uniref:Outer membrane beta-barrel family protein n=1 Tax=Nibrella saemangeumensis TaxID=1084526 RepID=A0ABP8MXW4_9BACT
MQFFLQKRFINAGLFLTFLLISLSAVQARDLQTITGTVNDPTGASVEFATIALHRAGDSVVVKTEFSDSKGAFLFERIAAGQYFVSVSMVGYDRYRTQPFNHTEVGTNLPTIKLSASGSTTLQEVTVQGRKPLFEREPDRLIVNVESSPLSAGATSLDILSRAPGVTVDQNDNIGLRGKQGVLVLIDGKRIPMTGNELADLLRATPANQIEKIELITNPSAKYDAAGSAGIISIKMKKDGRNGTNGNANVSYGQGRFSRLVGGVSLNHRQKNMNVFGSYTYSSQNNYNALDIHRDFYENRQFAGSSDQANYGFNARQAHSWRAGADYTLSKKTTVGIAASGIVNQVITEGSNVSKTYDALAKPLASYRSTNDRTSRSPNASGNLNVKHSFKQGSELTADADYAHYNTHRVQQLRTIFTFPSLSPFQLNGDQTGELIIRSAKADYSHSFGAKGRLEAGIKLSKVNSDNNVLFTTVSEGQTVIDTGKSNRFRYDETIRAGYINYSRSIKKLSFQLGLRGEQTLAIGRQDIGNQGFTRDYFQFFPSASVKQTLSDKHELAIAMSRRIDRPSYGQLNPFRAYIDATTYGSGNPYLLPQLSYNVELSHTFQKKFVTSFGISSTEHPIINVVQPAPDGDRMVVSTFQNLKRQDNFTLTLTVPVEVTKWWSMSNNVVGYYGHFIGDLAGTSINKGLPAFNINSSNTFTLGNGWGADLTAMYQSRELYGFMLVRPLGQVAVGVQKSVWGKKGTFRFNATDLFYTNKVRATSSYTNYVERFYQRQDSRVATLSFTYRFGRDTVPPARRRAGGAEEEKRRAGGS